MNGDIVKLSILIGYFIIGSLFGYVLEFIYRFIKEKKIVNPGFFKGPYLPIYGFGLLVLYLIPNIIKLNNILFLGIISTILITTLEYFSGVVFVIKMKIPLWDYSNKKGNICGIICLEFILYWFILTLFYYGFLYQIIDGFVLKMAKNDNFYKKTYVFWVLFIIDFFTCVRKIVKKRL